MQYCAHHMNSAPVRRVHQSPPKVASQHRENFAVRKVFASPCDILSREASSEAHMTVLYGYCFLRSTGQLDQQVAMSRLRSRAILESASLLSHGNTSMRSRQSSYLRIRRKELDGSPIIRQIPFKVGLHPGGSPLKGDKAPAYRYTHAVTAPAGTLLKARSLQLR
jgi:hypothetical protein